MSLKSLYSKLGSLPAYLFVNVATRAMTLLAFIFLAYKLTNEQYGQIEYVISIFFLLAIAVDCQLISYFSREYYEAKKSESVGKLLGTVFFSYLVIAFLSIMVLVGLSASLQLSVNQVILVVVSALMHAVIELYFMILRLDSKVSGYVKMSLLVYIVSSAALILPALFELNYLYSLYGYLGAKIVLGILILVIIKAGYTFQFSRYHLLQSFKYSIPLLPNVAIGWMLFNLPKTYLGWQGRMDQVAIFSVAARLAGVFQLVIVAFKNAWYPLFCRYVANQEGKQVRSQVYLELSRYFKVYIGFLLLTLICGGITVFALVDTELERYVNVAFWLVMAHLSLGLLSFYSFYILEIRKMYYLTLIYGLGGVMASLPYLFGGFSSLVMISAFIALGTFLAFVIVFVFNPKRTEFRLIE